MIFKCLYCNSSLTFSGLFPPCLNCHVSFEIDSNEKILNTLWSTNIKNKDEDNYILQIDFENQITTLSRFNGPIILTLDYALDVNQFNVNDWIDRLLNLKAFS
jgi:hypothetical protein